MPHEAHVLNQVQFDYKGLDEAFPPIDPEIRPFGSRVLVQMRLPKLVTAGGIILSQDMRDTEADNTQVAKVLAVGPLAFRNRTNGQLWPEGQWIQPGEFCRVPKYGGDRWNVRHGDDQIIFVLFEDYNVLGQITGNPLTVKAFL